MECLARLARQTEGLCRQTEGNLYSQEDRVALPRRRGGGEFTQAQLNAVDFAPYHSGMLPCLRAGTSGLFPNSKRSAW